MIRVPSNCQSGPASALICENRLWSGPGGVIGRSSGRWASVRSDACSTFAPAQLVKEIALHAFDSPSTANQVRPANEPTTLLHYNRQGPHRALHLRPPRADAPVPEPIRGIRRRPILGGLINHYEAAA
jgi:hypothetical protein